jgi:pimeloyl-ACP methyl ester carboxylesterase
VPYHNVLGIDVHYVEHGARAGDADHTIVLLHGFPLDHRSMVASFEPCLSSRPGWRRVYLDFPGMGRTEAPDWLDSTDAVFRVTHAAVQELVPSDIAIAGASFGGYIAAGLAAALGDRVTGLALIVPMVLPIGERDLAPRRILYREPGLTDAGDYEQLGVVLTTETTRRAREEFRAAVDEPAVQRISTNYAGSFPLVPASGSFDRPGLVVLGRQDSILGYNDQWRLFGQWPRTTVAVLDRAGHGLSIESPTLHDALINDWLDRIEQLQE